MIQQNAQADKFKQQLRESLQRDTLNSHAVKIARHANVYTCGDQDEVVLSHEELSEMVGTTRPRISMFMERFRKHGLLETNIEHSLVVKEKKLTDYLALRAAGYVCAQRDSSFQNRPILNRNRSQAGIPSSPNGGNLLWDCSSVRQILGASV